MYVYAEGGGSGAHSAPLQAEFRQAFADFLSKTDLGTKRRPRVVPCGGREQAFDSFRTAIAQGQNALLLVDSETPINPLRQPPAPGQWKPWAHLLAQASWETPEGAEDDDCHLMVQCMENWFLADKANLQAFFGQGFTTAALPVASVEAVEKSAVYAALQTATQKCKTKAPYGKGAHSFKLLRAISPEKVEAASPWAKRFFDELRKRKP
ncbi:MAG: DUF4276 family protein [Burkholderiales bacterium]|nr:DUF4276 family protein [Burkholderiales bacterium]